MDQQDCKKIRPLFVMHAKISAYKKDFDETNYKKMRN